MKKTAVFLLVYNLVMNASDGLMNNDRSNSLSEARNKNSENEILFFDSSSTIKKQGESVYQLINDTDEEEKFKFLGPKEIRTLVIEFLLKKMSENSNDHENKSDESLGDFLKMKEQLHAELEEAFNNMEKRTLFIDDINVTNSRINTKLNEAEYIVVTNPKDQKLDTVLSFYPNISVIFVTDEESLNLPSDKISPSIKNLIILGNNVTTIENNFLFRCGELQSLNLLSLVNVREIGDFFISNCYSLESLDLSAFSKVVKVGNDFLSSCDHLSSVIFSFFSLREIGGSFFSGDYNLRSIDLSTFLSLTKIGDSFFCNCAGLSSLNLSSFKNVKEIGVSFFSECECLSRVDGLDTLKAETIGRIFFSEGKFFEQIDLGAIKTSSYLQRILKKNNQKFLKIYKKCKKKNEYTTEDKTKDKRSCCNIQ